MLFQYPYYGGRGLWRTLVDWGFLDLILPFILIFVLVFGILQKIGLFTTEQKQPDRRINGVLALVIAGMIVLPHVVGLYPPNSDPIVLINKFLPSTGVLLLAVLCVVLLLGLAGGKIPSLVSGLVAVIAVGILLIIISLAVFPGFFPSWYFLRDARMQALLIILLVMGLIGWFVIRGPSTGTAATKFGETLKEWFGIEKGP